MRSPLSVHPLRSGLLLAALATLVASGCGDDEACTRVCPPGQACVLSSDGEQLCLEANCGGTACAPGQTCVDDVCVDDQTCDDCAASQHCVFGICVDDYTANNVCDPLDDCREACGTNARCLDACEDDRSASCASCLTDLASCEQTNDCDSGAATGCCEAEFCECFPSRPGCGNVPDCVGCQEDCADDIDCFNECRATDLACNLCLQPFDECVEESGSGACVDEFCDCLDSDLEPDCR